MYFLQCDKVDNMMENNATMDFSETSLPVTIKQENYGENLLFII